MLYDLMDDNLKPYAVKHQNCKIVLFCEFNLKV